MRCVCCSLSARFVEPEFGRSNKVPDLFDEDFVGVDRSYPLSRRDCVDLGTVVVRRQWGLGQIGRSPELQLNGRRGDDLRKGDPRWKLSGDFDRN